MTGCTVPRIASANDAVTFPRRKDLSSWRRQCFQTCPVQSPLQRDAYHAGCNVPQTLPCDYGLLTEVGLAFDLGGQSRISLC